MNRPTHVLHLFICSAVTSKLKGIKPKSTQPCILNKRLQLHMVKLRDIHFVITALSKKVCVIFCSIKCLGVYLGDQEYYFSLHHY